MLGNQGRLTGSCASGSLTGCSQMVGWSCGVLRFQLGKHPLPSSLTWSLDSLCSLRVVGLTASVPHWLLARDYCQLPATWASSQSISQHSRVSKFEGEKEHLQGEGTSKTEVTVFITDLRSDISLFYCVLLVRSKSLGPVHIHTWEGITEGCEYHKAGIIGSHFKCCLPCWTLLVFST